MPGAVRLIAGGDAGAAAAVPRARIAGIAEPRDALLAIAIDDVVVFRALHELPVLSEAVRPQAARETRHVERPLVRCAGLADDAANRDAQAVGQRRIESRALGRRFHDRRGSRSSTPPCRTSLADARAASR